MQRGKLYEMEVAKCGDVWEDGGAEKFRERKKELSEEGYEEDTYVI